MFAVSAADARTAGRMSADSAATFGNFTQKLTARGLIPTPIDWHPDRSEGECPSYHPQASGHGHRL